MNPCNTTILIIENQPNSVIIPKYVAGVQSLQKVNFATVLGIFQINAGIISDSGLNNMAYLS